MMNWIYGVSAENNNNKEAEEDSSARLVCKKMSCKWQKE
jgi:hypothetical protein